MAKRWKIDIAADSFSTHIEVTGENAEKPDAALLWAMEHRPVTNARVSITDGESTRAFTLPRVATVEDALRAAAEAINGDKWP